MYLKWLSAEERNRLKGIRHAGQRRHFLLGRAALRGLLAERSGARPEDVRLHQAADGGVDVYGGGLWASITHSGAHAVAGTGERRLGIDLERIQPRHERLARRILHQDEWRMFEALPLDRVRKVVLVWTLKEAALKSIRTGLRRPPRDVRLEIAFPEGEARGYAPDRAPLHLCFEERDGYYLSVAYDGML